MRVLRVCICLFALVNSQASTSFGSTWPPEPSQGSDPAQDQSKKPKTQKPTTKGASAGSNAAPASGQSATDKKTQDQKTAAFQSRLAKIFDPSRVDLSDYVPCHFTVSELLQLRPAPPTP